MLIVFEGHEGAGKTTQLGLLAARLRETGDDPLVLREPGGTVLGDSIRAILLDPAHDIVPRAEALLFLASRAQIVSAQVDPALRSGVTILMDRFFLSTYAYQIHGRGLAEDDVRSANALATGGLVPDLTLVLSLPSDIGLARAASRGAHDRIEQSGPEFHRRVEAAFASFANPDWQRSHPECGRIVAVDGSGTPADVHARVLVTLARNLPERFGSITTQQTIDVQH